MDEPQKNRVLVGLPERARAAKTALRDQEKLVENLRMIYGRRRLLTDSEILDQIGELLGFAVCKHPNAQRDSRGDVWCPDCREDVS